MKYLVYILIFHLYRYFYYNAPFIHEDVCDCKIGYKKGNAENWDFTVWVQHYWMNILSSLKQNTSINSMFFFCILFLNKSISYRLASKSIEHILSSRDNHVSSGRFHSFCNLCKSLVDQLFQKLWCTCKTNG